MNFLLIQYHFVSTKKRVPTYFGKTLPFLWYLYNKKQNKKFSFLYSTPLAINASVHLIRHAYSVPPSPTGEGSIYMFFLTVKYDLI